MPTPNETLLAQVLDALAKRVTGQTAEEITISEGGARRSAKSYTLAELTNLKNRLEADVAIEKSKLTGFRFTVR